MKKSELENLLKSMTLIEKIGQLIQLSGDFFGEEALTVGPKEKLGISDEILKNVGSVLNVLGSKKTMEIQKNYLENSKHKIPLLFMADVVYGYRTILPIPLAMGSTWNPNLVREGYQMIASEASKVGTHVTFAPMVDLVRDARWGRVLESTGEDVELNKRFAKSMVEGFQGDLKENSLISCVKHFAGYGASESGRDYNTVDMSERILRQQYLPAYKAALDAGARMVMTSFNTIDGIPATANQWLLQDILRKEWGFEGVIITDYAAIQELIAHGIASNESEASHLAIESTVDIDMKTGCYANQLLPLVKDGKISQKLIDKAVLRVLNLKNELGLFENPYRNMVTQEEEFVVTAENRKIARAVAEESLVLLKNEDNILPLNPQNDKIAFIGPYVESKELTGLWAMHAKPNDTISILDALSEMNYDNVRTAIGADYLEDYSVLGSFGKMISGGKENSEESIKKDLDDAVQLAKNSDVIVLTLGEHTLQSGEAGSRVNLGLPSIQEKLFNAIVALNKPVILVVFSGRPLVLTPYEKFVKGILQVYFPGTEGGHAIVDTLFGKINPSGKLSMSFPQHVGQLPLYYNHFSTGRPIETSSHSDRFMSRYLDISNYPLYPFGFGLSYSQFKYDNLQLSTNEMTEESSLIVSIDVENISRRDGKETIQLYIRDLVGSVVRPVKELIDFKKVEIKAGEKNTINFEINEKQLKFYKKDMSFDSEAGKFQLFIGKNSEEFLSDSFVLVKKEVEVN